MQLICQIECFFVDKYEKTDNCHLDYGRYDGSFILEENAGFLVDIEVEDSNGTLEIAGDLAELTINSSPGLLYAAAGGGIGILALVVVLVRRRRGS
jgi:hypothetical protein